MHETLFLIGYGLLEEERQLKTIAEAGEVPDRVFKFAARAESKQILPLQVENLLKGRRTEVEEQLPLVNWVLGK